MGVVTLTGLTKTGQHGTKKMTVALLAYRRCDPCAVYRAWLGIGATLARF